MINESLKLIREFIEGEIEMLKFQSSELLKIDKEFGGSDCLIKSVEIQSYIMWLEELRDNLLYIKQPKLIG